VGTRRSRAGKAAAFGFGVGFALVVVAIVLTYVLPAIFGWSHHTRGVLFLSTYGVAIAIAVPLTVRYARRTRRSSGE
jgi:hypothetical protein